MAAYYNEWEPYAAEWLRRLIAHGRLPAGDVDERSIADVQPADLRGYDQCHFFAGIGGWPLALQLAGWPDDRPVWTGSCPCQPYSVAGKQQGVDDERDLWPAWFRLIRELRPVALFGEQVAAAIGHGWLDRSFADLEGEGYACGSAVLPACAVGAPHRRDRLWFVAHTGFGGRSKIARGALGDEAADGRARRDWSEQDCDHVSDGYGQDDASRSVAAAAGGVHRRGESGAAAGAEPVAIADSGLRDGRSVLAQRGSQGRVVVVGAGEIGSGQVVGQPDGDGRFQGFAAAEGARHGHSAEPGGSRVHGSGGAVANGGGARLPVSEQSGWRVAIAPGGADAGIGTAIAERGGGVVGEAAGAGTERVEHADGSRQQHAGEMQPGRGQFGGRAGDRAAAGGASSGDVEHAALVGRGEGRPESGVRGGRSALASASAWGDAIWIAGADGKARRARAIVRRVAYGLPGHVAGGGPGDESDLVYQIEVAPLMARGVLQRVGKLKAYGNAIVPQVAAEFIVAFTEVQENGEA